MAKGLLVTGDLELLDQIAATQQLNKSRHHHKMSITNRSKSQN